MIIALASAGNAPGLTTTALALALQWPAPSLLVEASVAGGHIAAGYLRGSIPVEKRSIWDVALATRAGVAHGVQALANQAVQLDGRPDRLLLPGLPDAFWAPELGDDGWAALAEVMVSAGKQAYDIIIDLGPIAPDFPFPLATCADLVMLVMRPNLPQVVAARRRLDWFRRPLDDGAALGLCVVGEGPYQVRDLTDNLGQFDPVVRLPHDPRAAGRFSRGESGGFGARSFEREVSLVASGLHRTVVAANSAPVGLTSVQAKMRSQLGSGSGVRP